jgi:hypothetical protein
VKAGACKERWCCLGLARSGTACVIHWWGQWRELSGLTVAGTADVWSPVAESGSWTDEAYKSFIQGSYES